MLGDTCLLGTEYRLSFMTAKLASLVPQALDTPGARAFFWGFRIHHFTWEAFWCFSLRVSNALSRAVIWVMLCWWGFHVQTENP